MLSKEKCAFCGCKTKNMSPCDICNKLVCCDCATERADIGKGYVWVCPDCDKKYKYKG